MLPGDAERLMGAARTALRNAVAPRSGFRVGAALLTGEGDIVTGCNIENPSLMLTVCAERVALLKALSEGRRSFRAMAVACGDGRECFPCGACRQMLAEFAPGLVLLLDAPEGMKKYALEELLPHRFIP